MHSKEGWRIRAPAYLEKIKGITVSGKKKEGSESITVSTQENDKRYDGAEFCKTECKNGSLFRWVLYCMPLLRWLISLEQSNCWNGIKLKNLPQERKKKKEKQKPCIKMAAASYQSTVPHTYAEANPSIYILFVSPSTYIFWARVTDNWSTRQKGTFPSLLCILLLCIKQQHGSVAASDCTSCQSDTPVAD